jgi:H+/Cl- antiporter ClcA
MNLGKINLFFSYLHIISAFVLAILFYLHRNTIKLDTGLYNYQVTGVLNNGEDVTLSTKKEFSVSTQTIEILLVLMFCVSGFFHLFYYTNGFYTKSYLKDVRSGYNRFRWLEFSLTAAIIIFILSLLSGNRDLNSIISTTVLASLAMGIGFFVERSKRKEDKTIGIIIIFGVLATIFALLYSSLVKNSDEYTDNGGDYPDWAIGVLVGMGVWIFGLVLITVISVGAYGQIDYDFTLYEKLYTLFSYITKAYMGYYMTYGILAS